MTTHPDVNLNDQNGNNTNQDNKNESHSKRKQKKTKKLLQKKKLTVILSSSSSSTKECNSNAAAAAAAGTTTRRIRTKKSTTTKSSTTHNSGSLHGKRHPGPSSSSNKSKQQPLTFEKQYKKFSLLQLPHVKVTIRNIHGADKYGNVQNVINLVREIINDRNQNKHEIVSLMSADSNFGSEDSLMIAKVVTPRDVVLDETNVNWILSRGERTGKENDDDKGGQNEGDATASVADNDLNVQDRNGEPLGVIQDALINSSIEKEEDNKNVDSDTKKEAMEKDATENRSLVGDTSEQKKIASSRDPNTILAKILYVVPAKNSSRRGEIPGHCYLVLYPPMPSFYQEKLNTLSEKMQEKSQYLSNDRDEDARDGKTTKEETKTEQETENLLKEKDGDYVVESVVSSNHDVSTTPTITAADKTKALAQTRLLLGETISSLAYLCRDEYKKDQKYSGVQIEMSLNQKIWKIEDAASRGGHGIRSGKKIGMRNKYDSTLERNEDFLKFIEEKRRKEEELASRPKPPPGGDALNLGPNREISTSVDNGNNIGSTGGDEPISAILLHLREKKAAAKKAKKKKDKKKVEAPSGSSEKVDKAKKNVQGSKKGERKKKKKKSKQASVQSDVKVPPKMLRKT